MDWRLKPGKTASIGVKKWLKGLTIAECRTTILAIQMDALRAAIGDDAFDARYGSPDEALPEPTRLRIHAKAAESPLERRLFEQSAGTRKPGAKDSRNVKVGDWVYFYNHPKYLLKHPGGAWQGENAVYMGKKAGRQLFEGLGATNDRGRAARRDGGRLQPRARRRRLRALLARYAPDAPEVSSPSREFLDHDVATTRAVREVQGPDPGGVPRGRQAVPRPHHEGRHQEMTARTRSTMRRARAASRSTVPRSSTLRSFAQIRPVP